MVRPLSCAVASCPDPGGVKAQLFVAARLLSRTACHAILAPGAAFAVLAFPDGGAGALLAPWARVALEAAARVQGRAPPSHSRVEALMLTDVGFWSPALARGCVGSGGLRGMA